MDVFSLCSQQKFWSTQRRNRLAQDLSLATVPQIAGGKQTLSSLQQLARTASSHFRDGPLEGLIVRRDDGGWLQQRAKLVRPGFTEAIDAHWRSHPLEWNCVDWSGQANRAQNPHDHRGHFNDTIYGVK